MSDSPANPETSLGEAPVESELRPNGPTRWKAIVLTLLGLTLILTLFGGVGHLSGTGWFGYRQILHGEGELYVLNINPEPRKVSVDGRDPILVEADNAQLIEIVGGVSRVDILDASGKRQESLDVAMSNSHVLMNISKETCLAVSDISPFYKKATKPGEEPRLELVRLLKAGERVHVLNSRNIIWPRRTLPKRLNLADGRGLWVEIVACALLEDPEYLRPYLEVRMQERMMKEREEKGAPLAPPSAGGQAH